MGYQPLPAKQAMIERLKEAISQRKIFLPHDTRWLEQESHECPKWDHPITFTDSLTPEKTIEQPRRYPLAMVDLMSISGDSLIGFDLAMPLDPGLISEDSR